MDLEEIVIKQNRIIDRATEKALIIPLYPHLSHMSQRIKSEVNELIDVTRQTGIEPPSFLIKIVDEQIKRFDRDVKMAIIMMLN